MKEIERAIKLMLTEYPDVLTVQEVAKILGCDDHQIYKMIDYGELFATRPGKAYRISKYSLIGYLIGAKGAMYCRVPTRQYIARFPQTAGITE